MTSADPFSPGEFDPWAETYDHDVIALNRFPFDGYDRALETVVKQAAPEPGMSVLDIGTGTGNLALRFAEHGSELWCSDFSESMLEKARKKLPLAHFVLHDLRADWPAELDRRFDRVVSAYVFHHFDLDGKVGLCRELVAHHLAPKGRLVIADLSFQNQMEMDAFAVSVGDLWEAEPYWLVEESLPALEQADLKVDYVKVSRCAGVYSISVMRKFKIST
jgi:cyclopropane fatty-acyl-phospholipid synthase-like methyltransferase